MSNQNDKISYNAFDATPVSGVNLYRIKAVETTGKVVYSKIMNVNLSKNQNGLVMYPNPVSGHVITVGLATVARGQYHLRVVNMAGQSVYVQTIISEGNNITQTLDLPASVKPGLYNIIVTGSDYHETKSFILQ